jgi:uncharacterized membrane protein
VGGWLGISYQGEKIDRLAAILFGAGGGLIGDSVGLLLTLSAHEYWADVTYTFVIVFVTLASILILLNRYRSSIRTEFAQFLLSNASLYFGVFLAIVSLAFFLETDNVVVNAVSAVLTTVACLIVLAYFVQRVRVKHQEMKSRLRESLYHSGCDSFSEESFWIKY